MHVAHLSLSDFRSYGSVDLALEPGVATFVGPNGEGKTNLLEAINYVATLSSHRVATDAPLVRQGCERAIVRSDIRREGDGRRTLVEIEINPGRANRARLNRASVRRSRDIHGTLRVTIFSPDDIALVKGDPAERRRFLDDLLVARAPRYAAIRADYDRVVRQRNALLKSAAGVRPSAGGRHPADVTHTLDVWDTHLARAGSELLAGRLELVGGLRPLVRKIYEAVAHDEGPAELEYVSSLGPENELPAEPGSLADKLSERLMAMRATELARGVGLVGPHRDDLTLNLSGMPARGYASHGESWSFALALRLAGYELLRADGGEPVLLLDDVFTELDSARRERLAEFVAGAEQVLVTAAVDIDVPPILSGARFDVAGGEVRRVR